MIRFLIVSTVISLCSHGQVLADEAVWKTAYVKRGFVGMFDASATGGIGATQRMRTPLQFSGSKVRVYVRGGFEQETELAKMALTAGADDMGKITGKPFPILFKGNPGLKLEKGLKTAVSDEMEVPVTAGTWYIQDQYASAKFPYAYEIDRGNFEAGDHFEKESLKKSLGVRTGIVYRVDVLTTDPRNAILCYGDSITHGFGSTPNSDKRYPSILGKLLDRPVLNLGQNSDTVSHAIGSVGEIGSLKGVDTVVFLMGINDIVLGSKVNSAKAYADIIGQVSSGCKQKKIKFYLGTIPPSGGLKQFDKDPAKEQLRQEINAWIRKGNGVDGVIDFDAALADPATPVKMREDCQIDWIHPSELGYQKMAEAAAAVLKAK